ncbi:hypothetical protein BDV28DRAFT_111784 [Aspergillus coremiiformis]|uniref:Uncharacterized protein n=1 Tax=Aspergillus coremiiformis TaxID=138285 RepID=A0A5N6Z695_9EURO|nr:hypothetical protein BDV28DRAFT_111784 [Aspergillus coremiiformis]
MRGRCTDTETDLLGAFPRDKECQPVVKEDDEEGVSEHAEDGIGKGTMVISQWKLYSFGKENTAPWDLFTRWMVSLPRMEDGK